MEGNSTQNYLTNYDLLNEKHIHLSYLKKEYHLGLFCNFLILLFAINYYKTLLRSGRNIDSLMLLEYSLILLDIILHIIFIIQTHDLCTNIHLASIKRLIYIEKSQLYFYRYLIGYLHYVIFSLFAFHHEMNFESNYIIIIYYSKFILTLVNYYTHFDHNDINSFYRLHFLYSIRKNNTLRFVKDFLFTNNNLKSEIADKLIMTHSCCICLMDFTEGEKLCLLICGHVFHNSCLVCWLRTNRNCPYCRADLKLVDNLQN